MIAFACHTWTFSDLLLPEALGTIARLGFRHVDIGSGTALNALNAAASPRKRAAEIRDDLTLYNLSLSDLYFMLPRISLSATPEDAERRSREIELFTRLIPFAVELNAPGITVSPGIAPAHTDAEARAQAFAQAADALRTMCDAARASGIPLSIEPHMDSIAPTPAAARALLDAVPGLRLTLDLAEFACQNIAREDVLALLPHTRHVQIRQAARGKLQVPHDKGSIDLRQVIVDLRDAGYSGAISIELLNMPGRHGAAKIQPVREALALRDALRAARDT
jgi:sugar phosphate isomerase/epimerase